MVHLFLLGSIRVNGSGSIEYQNKYRLQSYFSAHIIYVYNYLIPALGV